MTAPEVRRLLLKLVWEHVPLAEQVLVVLLTSRATNSGHRLC